MKNSILVVLSFVFGSSYGQNSVLVQKNPVVLHSQIFSLSQFLKK